MEALDLTLRYEYWWNDSHPSKLDMSYKRNGLEKTKEISNWMTKETTKYKSKLAFSQAILI